MEAILSTVGAVFTKAIEWVGVVGQTVIANDILLLFGTLSLVGIGVGLYKRLISVN